MLKRLGYGLCYQARSQSEIVNEIAKRFTVGMWGRPLMQVYKVKNFNYSNLLKNLFLEGTDAKYFRFP